MIDTLPVLIDIDNVANNRLRGDPQLLLDTILQKVSPALTSSYSRVRARFYGGWYEGASLSRSAQSFISSLPAPPSLVIPMGKTKAIVNFELAYGLHILPGTTFPNTLRLRTNILDLRCKTPQQIPCAAPSCPFDAINTFVRSGKCPESSCATVAKDVLRKKEQKLVDTNLAVDLVTMRIQGAKDIVAVSSDDDMWPGFAAAAAIGATVHRFHTRSVSLFNSAYAGLAGNGVREYTL